jgi:hypothetical protein
MPTFEVDYSYESPEYGTVIVEADNIDDAEYVAVNKLSDDLSIDITDIYIETVKEKKN